VPAADLFDIPEKTRAEIQPFPVTMHHYAEGELPPSMKTASEPRTRYRRGSRVAVRQRATRVAHVAPAAAAKHQATATGKRAVHVASLKKRKI
jgi:hypothetical protein